MRPAYDDYANGCGALGPGYELQRWNGPAWTPLVAGLTGTTRTHGGLAAGETCDYIIRSVAAGK